jgi:3-oxoacyl-[acyl-carrier protein] reductase
MLPDSERRGYGGRMGRLERKVAVVTGAGRGIGRSTAVRFAREGAAVVVNDIDVERANEAAAAVAAIGGRAVVSTDDTTELGAARALVARTVEEFGTLDILVNNAGTTRDRTFHNLDDELWDLVSDTNVRTAFDATLAAVGYTTESAKRETAERGTPRHRRGPSPGSSGGSTSNVNAVAPGFIETRLNAHKGKGETLGMPEEIRQMALMVIALGRFGRPKDVADTHLLLASSEADCVTHAILPVAGEQLGT